MSSHPARASWGEHRAASPSLTTTLLSSAGDGVHVVTTTIPVPAFTITDVSLQPLTLQQTDTASYKINPVQSITPPSFIYTLPPNHATFPVTTPTPASSTDSNTPIVIVPPVTFQTTPVPVTIQSQPTYSVDYPDPPTPLPPVTRQATDDFASGLHGAWVRQTGLQHIRLQARLWSIRLRWRMWYLRMWRRVWRHGLHPRLSPWRLWRSRMSDSRRLWEHSRPWR